MAAPWKRHFQCFTRATYDLAPWTGAEIFLLIVCACVPTLKPLYDIFRETPIFSFSYFSSKRYSSDRKTYYGFDGKKSPKKALYGGGHSDGSPVGRINAVDKVVGVLTKAIAHSEAESDPWNNGDRNALIGMGDINVQRGREVQSGWGSDGEALSTTYPGAAWASGCEEGSRG